MGAAAAAVEFVMPGLVLGIHVVKPHRKKDVDGWDKPGHDGISDSIYSQDALKLPVAARLPITI